MRLASSTSALCVAALTAIIVMVGVGAAPPLSPMYAAICAQMADCDANSGPVCAIDAAGVPKTFANACSVTLDNCLRNTNFAVVRKGEC